MKSREKRPLPPMTAAPQSTRRNWRIFMLLEMVPEFKRDIANIRAKFGIPLRGYITDHEKSPHADCPGPQKTV
jgi:hypothetical protein